MFAGMWKDGEGVMDWERSKVMVAPPMGFGRWSDLEKGRSSVGRLSCQETDSNGNDGGEGDPRIGTGNIMVKMIEFLVVNVTESSD
ncbi:hypothetical protein LIER_27251 [Lithospermum erythrorhizon]|uniref:Uncharacterized protein n=1 Tax=Lithospermum erythrorhizon TaxID=34254 RepID=A0AAV3REE1_LITER